MKRRMTIIAFFLALGFFFCKYVMSKKVSKAVPADKKKKNN